MALPEYDMRQLLEAGVHFGHQKHRWNPKMGTFIFGDRNNIHIIDLAQTVPLLHQALVKVSDIVAKGGRVLFVGTKRQASDIVAESAKRCAQYYINHRWLGGTLTNWRTVSNSIRRLKTLEEMLSGEAQGLTKKEQLQLTRERDKLERALGGIKDMGGIPNALFVIDTNKEAIAVAEAKKLKIPVIAIVDSNSNPDDIDFPVPGNDDAGRAISLYCDLMARAALDGLEKSTAGAGIDPGAVEKPVVEEALKTPKANGADKAAKKSAEKAKPEASKVEAKADPEKAEPEAPKVEAKADPEKVEPEAPRVEAKADPVKEEPVKEEPKKEAAEAATGEKASGGAFVPLKAPDGDADDLKLITGVGPALETKLNELGVYHFWQIAKFTPEDVAKVDDALSFKGRIDRDGWLAQAKTLAADKE